MAHFEQISLSRIANEARGTEAEELSPDDYEDLDPILLEENDRGGFIIVDGFHRTSGLAQWAEANSVNTKDISIEVVVTDDDDDEDLVAIAADGFAACNEEAVGVLIRSAQKKKTAPRRRLIENAGALRTARRTRETFMDRAPTKEVQVKWEWPRNLQWVGHCEAVMYASDKWKRPGTFEDYKHVAEAPQKVFCTPGFIRDYHSGRPLDLPFKEERLPKDMPEAFAELANIFGVQLTTLDDEVLQVNIARAKLGSAKHRKLGTFLFVYSASGVHLLITGDKLNVEKDGITG